MTQVCINQLLQEMSDESQVLTYNKMDEGEPGQHNTHSQPQHSGNDQSNNSARKRKRPSQDQGESSRRPQKKNNPSTSSNPQEGASIVQNPIQEIEVIEEVALIPSEEIQSSPTVIMEENDDLGQDEVGQVESDEEVARVQHSQAQGQRDLSAFPPWLRQRIEESTIVETYQPAPVEELLVNIQKSNQKKKATVLSKITQDSAGNKEVHIAVPRIDKELENMTPEDYNMTTIGMGPITREQVEEELQDSVNSVRSMLKQEREARMKVEQDFNTLKHYIQQVMQPIQQKEATPIPLSILPQETISQVENMRTSSQMMKGWTEKTEEKAYTHLEEIVQVYDRVIKLKDRVQALLRNCAEFKPIKEQYMPQLNSLMEAPLEDLIHDKVIDRDTPHL